MISFETLESNHVDTKMIVDLVRKLFVLSPLGIITGLDLLNPIYRDIAAYGHFGRDDLDLSWESADKADLPKSEAGI